MDDLDTLKSQFLYWEQASRDTIDFKKAYVDMADDLISGLVLSQIVYWYLPGRNGVTKLRVEHGGTMWIAKPRHEWYDEVRVTPKQLDRALGILEERGLVVTALYKFDGAPTKHVRLDWPKFLDGFRVSILPKGQNPFSPNVEMDFPQTAKSLTENTTENTTENHPVLPKAKPTRAPRMPVNAGEMRSTRETPPVDDRNAPVMQSSLAAFLLKSLPGQQLTKKHKAMLAQKVSTSKGPQPSPNEAYDTSPVFRAWIEGVVVPYFANCVDDDPSVRHLINLIRAGYERGKDNYFEYREGYRQQHAAPKAEPVADIKGVPTEEWEAHAREIAERSRRAQIEIANMEDEDDE